MYKAEAVGLIRIMQKEYNKIRTLSTDFVEYLEKYRKLDFFINNFRFIRYLGIGNQMIPLRVTYKFSRKIVPQQSVMWIIPVIIPYAVLIPGISSGMNEYRRIGSVFQE